MKNAKTLIDPSAGISLNQAVRAGRALRSDAGSCNGCADGVYRLDDQGRPLVMSVQLRNLTFRLCASCAATLKGEL